MWWKLTALIIVTVGLIFCIVPIRTHAALVDPGNPQPSTRWTLWSMVSSMYLTTGTVGLICAILVVAAYIAFRIIRSLSTGVQN